MFPYCTDPDTLDGVTWLSCYLTTGVHFQFYNAFFKVLLLLAITAPVALGFGFLGAMAARSHVLPLSLARAVLHRHRAGRARHRLLSLLRDRARPGVRMDAPPGALSGLDRSDPPGLRFHRLQPGQAAAELGAAMDAPDLFLRACDHHLLHRFRRLRRQRALWRDAGRAPRAAGNRRGLRHVATPDLLADPGAADVGLCPAGPVEPLA